MVVSLEQRNDLAVIWVDYPPVNALSQAVRAGLSAIVETIAGNDQIKGAVLACRGSTFIAGADIKEFGKPPSAPLLPDVITALEQSKKPILAAIHGTALGGGFEVALGCTYRTMAASARVGLPEVNLGIIPGAGGTQRLPRLTGIEAALDMVTSGKPVAAKAALAAGMVDQVFTVETVDELVTESLTYLDEVLAGGSVPAPVSARPVPAHDATACAEKIATITQRARGKLSPVKAAEAVMNATTMSFVDGMQAEREIFLALRAHPQSSALRAAFFAERQTAKIPALKDVAPRDVQTIGIIGAGTMGAGIAVACLDAGYQVTLVETNEAAAEAGEGRVRATYDRLLGRGRLSQAAYDKRLAALSMKVGLENLATTDLIIEAVFEDEAVKREVFTKLDEITKPGAILATNTSYLDVDVIAKMTKRPQDVVGMHFFSPANIMRLLEIIPADDTQDDVLATAFAIAKRLKKVPVLAGNCPGFIGNRLFNRYRRQVEMLIEDGAMPAEVDKAMTDFGFAMGPFAVFDLAGLDIAWRMRKANAATRDPKERYVDILDTICEAGHFGQKTGAGYYRYEKGNRKPLPHPEAEEIIVVASAKNGIRRRAFTPEEIVSRVMAALVNEGAKILEEGMAQKASDIDQVEIHGYGFPAFQGGPMHWADSQGLAAVLEQIEAMSAASGPGWEPAQLLKDLVRDGGTLADWTPATT